jgi:hypothetical protein
MRGLILVGTFVLGIMYGVQIATNSSKRRAHTIVQTAAPKPKPAVTPYPLLWHKLPFDARFSEN